MSERPSVPKESNEPSSGWHQPSERGHWYEPEEKTEGIIGWRVPTLPTTLDSEPKQVGEWHLPKAEDTVYTPQDVSEVIGITEPPPDAIDPIDALADAITGKPDGKEEETKPAPLASPEDLLELALRTGGISDEDDEDSFSMSELVALASLVGEAPTTATTPTQVARTTSTVPATHIDMTDLSPAERAILTSTGETEVIPQPADIDEGAVDPAEYARRQLAALGEQAEPTATLGGLLGQTGAEAPAVDDPAAYARRQLELLGGATGAVSEATPPPQVTSPYDPATVELATRFRNTENQVRALRQQYQSGLMSREDLQTQLRQLMILDNNQVWWMMGVETDTWYKFVNGNWVAAAPPTAATGAQPEVSGQQPSLAYVQTEQPYQTQPTMYDPNQYQYSTGAGFNVEDEPLPQQVDRIDQGMTMVSPSATRFVGEADAYAQPTVVGTPSYAQPTVMAEPVQYGEYEGIESPYDIQAEPPAYDLEAEAPIYEDIAEKHRQSTLQLVAIIAAIVIGLGFVGAAGIVLLAVGWYNGIVSQFEPQIVALQNYQPQFQTARILDSRGDLIVELNSQEGGARTEVELADIAPEMLFAVIASENERFYDDPGWDLVAIVRAFFQNLTAGEVESGASTITQQIARNLVLQNTEVTAERKIQELVVAAELAKRYDKNFILELYLNEIFFGNQSYGVEAAAEYYFGHTAADLNIAESALLAGLIQSPAAYDPVINRDASFGRMDFVINRMVEVGCIQFQHAPYLSEPFCISSNDIFTASGDYTGRMAVQVAQVESRPYEPRDVQIRYPHFVNLVQAQLDAIYGPGAMFAQGFTVRTTLVPQIQDTAQNALVNQLAALVNQGVNTGAVMVTDPNTGAIRAMVGSPDFNNAEIDGQVNNALTWQQPGSSIKPIVYTGALEGVDKNGDGRLDFTEYYTPASILWDVPTSYPDGTPIRNFDGQFHGPTPLRYALGNSYNIPAVKAYGFIGDAKFQDVAARMGLDFLPDAVFGLPTGIGATEVRLYDMMEAYGTLASGGRYVRLYAIESVTDNEGRTVELPPREEPRQVVQPQIAYLMQSILSDDNARASAFGTGSVLTLPGYPTIDYVAAKTGTSNDARDLWTMGFTKTAVVGVWLGRPDNNPTFTNGSFTAVAPVWNQVMRAAVQGVQPQAFTNPGNVVLQQICTDTGTLPGANCPAQRGEFFLVSNPPPPADQSFVQSIEVDSWTGLRANANCPDNRVAMTFANIPDATAVNWLNTTAQGQAYAARIGLPLPLQVAPTGECPFGAIVPSVRLLSPSDGMTLTGNVSLTGQVSANQAEFNRYQLYYAPAATPDQWVAIGPASTAQQPQAGAVLGQWDTLNIPNGTYILRLEVIANNGGFINKQVTVNVQNVLPTATPTVPVIPTSPPILTPIPFDTLPAQSVPPGGGPTPTIAVPTG